ncbi:MAG TPA: prolyl oligopeptidase family serine peptidase [Candidatus Limnocylindria bacterium]|nr:prolyl oligopeptidase family serine peptidase [Candidatus Limnocylindria bacterium]
MLQRVSFPVAGTAVAGILHLPDGETLGGVVELGGRVSDIEAGRFVCEALAAAGVAALRLAYRTGSDVPGNVADAAGAIRLMRAHPAIPQRVGIAGHSYGGAIAGIVAGRDSRIRAAALIVPPAEREYFGTVRPMAELSRTRAKVLLVGATADAVVPPEHTARYAVLLRQAGVAHRVVQVEGADHDFSLPSHRTAMLDAVTAWFRETLAA